MPSPRVPTIIAPKPHQVVAVNEPFLVLGKASPENLSKVTVQVDAGPPRQAAFDPDTAIYSSWGQVAEARPHVITVTAIYQNPADEKTAKVQVQV
jgi:hypothetical protein